jgi:hypothetical protein
MIKSLRASLKTVLETLRVLMVLLLLSAVLSLSACSEPATQVTTPTQADPEFVFTAAAWTAEAERVELTMFVTMPPPEDLLKTAKAPTPTPTRPTHTPTATATLTPTPTKAPASEDERAGFILDVSVPDGTVFQPNEVFTKTWRLKNLGSTTWTPDYALSFADGDLMSGPVAVPLPLEGEAAPGETVDISVRLIAPPNAGDYRGYWQLENSNGEVFGVGTNADEAVWVDIKVEGARLSSATPAPVPGGSMVKNVLLSVDAPAFEGDCPHTFVFSAQFSLQNPTTVSYSLEAGTEGDTEIKLPPPATNNLDSGQHTVFYELTFAGDITGWVRLRITAPEEVISNQVNFALVCQQGEDE